MNYIGIDLGTSSVKLVLMDTAGHIIANVSKSYPIDYPKAGWSEQNPYDWYDACMEGMKELLEQIEEVREELNSELQTVKCFVSKFQRLNEAHVQGAEVIQEYYPTMQTRIRASAVVARSTFARTPVALYSPRSAAAEEYEKFLGVAGDELELLMHENQDVLKRLKERN